MTELEPALSSFDTVKLATVMVTVLVAHPGATVALGHPGPVQWAVFTMLEVSLAFTEAVTLISDDGVPDDVWNELTAVFDEKETVQLLMTIAAINVYNRINVTMRTVLREEPVLPA